MRLMRLGKWITAKEMYETSTLIPNTLADAAAGRQPLGVEMGVSAVRCYLVKELRLQRTATQ